MSVAHDIEEKIRTDDIHISERIDFSGLLLSQPVLGGLTKAGFKRPSPIQLEAIPLGRCGLDLIVQAKSGTGKTCVFTVIALEGLNLNTGALQVLILAPTREIAIQIREVVTSIGSCMPGLKCHSFIGGTAIQQDRICSKQCQIAAGTPGRIKQLIELGVLKTQSIRLFVMDEADKLLGGGLTESINWIYSTLPDNKQILALSATYPETLAQHLTRYMRNPTFVRLNITDPALIGIKQFHVIVPDSPLPNKVFESKTAAVVNILSSVSFEQCLIFSNLQIRAQSLQCELQSKNWPTECIAGCLDQRDRSMAMEQLKAYKCRILISTDLTSRGIDADRVNMVINLDVPLDHETYLHRIGRAGRFGSHGAAISIVSKGQQEKELWAVERKCKTNIPKLPDPIPTDLATRSVILKLSDVVTTEKIITHSEPFLSDVHCSAWESVDSGYDVVDRVTKVLKSTSSIGPFKKDKKSSMSDSNVECLSHVSKPLRFVNGARNQTEEENSNTVCVVGEKFEVHEEKDIVDNVVDNIECSCAVLKDKEHQNGSEDYFDLGKEYNNCQLHFPKRIKDGCVSFSWKSNNSQSWSHSSVPSLDGKNGKQDNTGGSDVSSLNNEIPDERVVSICSKISDHDKHPSSLEPASVQLMRTSLECLKFNQGQSDDQVNGTREMSKENESGVQPTASKLKDCCSQPSFMDPAAAVEHSRKAGGDFIPDKFSQPSCSTTQLSQSVHNKQRKQKHPRPFALASFLKGLNKSSAGDNSPDCAQSSHAGSQIETEQNLVSNKTVGNTQPSGLVTTLPDFVKDDIETCNLMEQKATPRNDPNGGILNTAEKISNELLVKRDERSVETPLTREQFSNSSDFKESHPNMQCHPILFQKDKNTFKSFSELQTDFENFHLSPRKINIKDLSDSVVGQVSKEEFQSSNVRKLSNTRFSKLMEAKKEVKILIEKARLERVVNPDIVKDFLGKALSKTSETSNDSIPVQPHGTAKGKRKKKNDRWSGAPNWRDKSNDLDWRSKKNSEWNDKKVTDSGMKKKDFDELLKEQLVELKENKGEKIHRVNENKSELGKERARCVVTVDDDSHLEVGLTQAAIDKTKAMTLCTEDIPGNVSNANGDEPTVYHQPPKPKQHSSNVQTHILVQGNPDKECQMLDQMHLEMLRKRKEKKAKMAELKRMSGNVDAWEGGSTKVVTTSTASQREETAGHLPLSNSSETNCVGKKEESFEGNQTRSGSCVISGKSDDIKMPSSDHSVDNNQTLFLDMIPVQESLEKLIVGEQPDKTVPIASNRCGRPLCHRHTLIKHDNCMTGIKVNPAMPQNGFSQGDRTVSQKHNYNVLKFEVRGLDLSSDSDDVEITLSSTTEVSDITLSDDDISNPVAGRLRFVKSVKTQDRKYSSRADVKCSRKSLHHKECVYTGPENSSKWRSGTFEIDERSHFSCIEFARKKKIGKISVPVKDIKYPEKKSQQKSKRKKQLNFNLSNNKSRQEMKSSDRAFTQNESFQDMTHLAAMSSPQFYSNKGSNEFPINCYPHINSSKYDTTKQNRNFHRYHNCDSASGSDSPSEDATNACDSRSSPFIWWSHWSSPYNPYATTQWPSYAHTNPYHYYLPHHPAANWFSQPHHPNTGHYNHNYYNCYSQAAMASCQRQYISHMARVMNEMIDKSGRRRE